MDAQMPQGMEKDKLFVSVIASRQQRDFEVRFLRSRMNQLAQIVSTPAGTFAVLVLAAYLEVQGDACFQSGLYHASGMRRTGWFIFTPAFREQPRRLLDHEYELHRTGRTQEDDQ